MEFEIVSTPKYTRGRWALIKQAYVALGDGESICLREVMDKRGKNSLRAVLFPVDRSRYRPSIITLNGCTYIYKVPR